MPAESTSSINRRIVQSAGIVMVSVLLSRILGFFRDWTVAHQIGSNAITDAYYAAFTLPDFLNYLVAGGSLSLTFIPILTRCIAEKRDKDGWRVFSTAITFMGILLVAGIILGELFAPQLVRVIAPGFHGSERQRVVFLTRLMLPAQICFYLGGILSAVQYAKGQFALPSLAPVVYNTGIILGGVLLSSRIGITGFAVGCWLELLREISCCKFTGRGGPEPSFIRTLTFAIRISNSSSSSPYRLCWRFPSYLPTTGLSAGSAHILPQLPSRG